MKKLKAHKLTFHKETLRALSAGELERAHGGAKLPEPQGSGLLSLCADKPCPKPPPTPSVLAVACPTEPKPVPTSIVV